MIGRTFDSSDPQTSRGRIPRSHAALDETEYRMDPETATFDDTAFCGYSPLPRVVPSAPMEPKEAPCSAPPASRPTFPMLTSPNVSQPRSSVLRMPYSADHRIRGNYRYYSTPTQQRFDDVESEKQCYSNTSTKSKVHGTCNTNQMKEIFSLLYQVEKVHFNNL